MGLLISRVFDARHLLYQENGTAVLKLRPLQRLVLSGDLTMHTLESVATRSYTTKETVHSWYCKMGRKENDHSVCKTKYGNGVLVTIDLFLEPSTEIKG